MGITTTICQVHIRFRPILHVATNEISIELITIAIYSFLTVTGLVSDLELQLENATSFGKKPSSLFSLGFRLSAIVFFTRVIIRASNWEPKRQGRFVQKYVVQVVCTWILLDGCQPKNYV